MIVGNPRELGLAARERRLELGLRQVDVADRAGVSRQWLGELEGGKGRAELGLVLRLLRVLGLAVDLRRVGDGGTGDEKGAGDDVGAGDG